MDDGKLLTTNRSRSTLLWIIRPHPLDRGWEIRMRLRDVMTSPPVYAYLLTPLWRAARMMDENDCGFLPVVRNGVAVGVVARRDITAAIALEGRSPYETSAGEIMASPVHGLPEEATLAQAANLMRERNIHRIVVTDADGILRGVVSLGDLAFHLEEAATMETLRILTKNSGPEPVLMHHHWQPPML